MTECGYCGQNNPRGPTKCVGCGSPIPSICDPEAKTLKPSLRVLGLAFLAVVAIAAALIELTRYERTTSRLAGPRFGDIRGTLESAKRTPALITNHPPRDYPPEAIKEVLQRRLSGEEVDQVVDPL